MVMCESKIHVAQSAHISSALSELILTKDFKEVKTPNWACGMKDENYFQGFW
jgi:hypothetical protein